MLVGILGRYLGRHDGRTLMEVVLGLGIMGILTASLLSFLSFFYRTEMALSAAPANRRLLTAAVSFIETQLKEESFAGGKLTAATDRSFRIEVPPGEPGRGGQGPHETPTGSIELRFENGRLTLFRKSGDFETVINLLPSGVVVTRFEMLYRDTEGRVLDHPINFRAVRSIEVTVEGYIDFVIRYPWSIELVFHVDGSLVEAEFNWFRIENQSSGGGARRPRCVEIRYENDGVTLVRKDGGIEMVVRPVPQDMVVSDFSVTYKDAEGHMLEPPLDLSEVRTVSFEIRAYHRQDPSRSWVSEGTFPILADGSERR